MSPGEQAENNGGIHTMEKWFLQQKMNATRASTFIWVKLMPEITFAMQAIKRYLEIFSKLMNS